MVHGSSRLEARSESGKTAALVLILAILYVATGYLGLQLAHYHTNATLIWPPTGLALAALILHGTNLWPGVLLGALALSLTTGTAWLPSLGIAVGNTLEAMVGAVLLVRVADFQPNLERVQDVIAFILIGVFGCTIVSPTLGVTTLALSGSVTASDFGLVWLLWWLGDAGGALVVAPVLLLGRRGIPSWKSLFARPEAWLALGGAATASLLVFSGVVPGSWALLAAFLPFPFLAWAGSRLGPRGAVTTALAISGIATVGTALGRGPFVLEGTHQSMLLLWAYAIIMGWTGLALAAAISQRELAVSRYLSGEQDRLRIERRMQEAQRLEALGLLAGGIAHDFNNILTVIRGNAVLLIERLASDEESVARLRKIEAGTDRAASFCQRLLTYAGREHPSKEPVSLPFLLEEAAGILKTFIPKKTAFETRVAPNTPAVEGDPTQLQQVVMNLVLNAAEAIGDRRGRIFVEVGGARLESSDLAGLTNAGMASPGDFGFVEVSDTGKGMAPDVVQRIFDPFFSTKLAGRGLGLASVLGIARAHAGAIDLSSDPGTGSRFRVYIPVATVVPPSAPPLETRHPSSGEKRLILVAEDEPDVRELVVHVLEAAGYRTLAVANGREALDRYRSSPEAIDAVLLDVSMPGMSGSEVLADLRALGAGVPILLMSGHEVERACGGEAPDGFLRKPFRNETLLEAVARALGQMPTAGPD